MAGNITNELCPVCKGNREIPTVVKTHEGIELCCVMKDCEACLGRGTVLVLNWHPGPKFWKVYFAVIFVILSSSFAALAWMNYLAKKGGW